MNFEIRTGQHYGRTQSNWMAVLDLAQRWLAKSGSKYTVVSYGLLRHHPNAVVKITFEIDASPQPLAGKSVTFAAVDDPGVMPDAEVRGRVEAIAGCPEGIDSQYIGPREKEALYAMLRVFDAAKS